MTDASLLGLGGVRGNLLVKGTLSSLEPCLPINFLGLLRDLAVSAAFDPPTEGSLDPNSRPGVDNWQVNFPSRQCLDLGEWSVHLKVSRTCVVGK